MGIIAWIIFGLIAGVVAKLIMPVGCRHWGRIVASYCLQKVEGLGG